MDVIFAMRIVNWNVERPSIGSPKNATRANYLLGLNPDIVLLTETSIGLDLGANFTGFFTRPSPRKPREGEAVAAVWFRNDLFMILGEIEAAEPREAVCVEVEFRGVRYLVYGSIIPYHGYKGPDGSSRQWVEHKKAIEWHRNDWMRLKEKFPNHELIAGGDYNQNRDGVGKYGTIEVRNLLSDAMADAGLACVTEADFVATHGLSRRNIDHLCLSEKLAARVIGVQPWEGTIDGVRLSDHNGITIDLYDTDIAD